MKSPLAFSYYYCLLICASVAVAIVVGQKDDLKEAYTCLKLPDGYPCTPSVTPTVPTQYVCVNDECVVDPCAYSIAGDSCSYECVGQPYGTKCSIVLPDKKLDQKICDGNDACIEDPCSYKKCLSGTVCVMGNCIPKCTLPEYACRESFNDGCASESCNEDTGFCEMDSCRFLQGSVCKTISEPCNCSWLFPWRCSTCEVEYHCGGNYGCTCNRVST